MLARRLPITVSTSAFFQRAFTTRHSFHLVRPWWVVAWDLDETLITLNSFYPLSDHVKDTFASIEFMREKMQKIRLGEKLKAHPHTANLMKDISTAGGGNCIVTANPYINIPALILEYMGFSQAEISHIPVFRSTPGLDKNHELQQALACFGISDKFKMAFVDDNHFNTEYAREHGFLSFHPDNIWQEQSEFLNFIEKNKKTNSDLLKNSPSVPDQENRRGKMLSF